MTMIEAAADALMEMKKRAEKAEAEVERLREELGECWAGVQAQVDQMVESQTRAVLEPLLLEHTP